MTAEGYLNQLFSLLYCPTSSGGFLGLTRTEIDELEEWEADGLRERLQECRDAISGKGSMPR